MNVLIIIPGNEQRLGQVASAIKQFLLSASKLIAVDVVPMDALTSPELIERHEAIIIGTLTVKKDIYWPLQVAVDRLMQKIPREQIARKIVTGFTVSDSLADSSRNIEAILWVFTESNARVLEPLFLHDGDSGERETERISDYIRGLKGIIV
jgi:hypothetical protein